MEFRRFALVAVCVLFVFVAVSPAPVPAAGPPAADPSATASPAAAAPDWRAKAMKQIAEEEYQITWQSTTAVEGLGAAWQASNRAHGFRTYFTEAGIRVVPRTGEPVSWVWGLALVGYGRGEARTNVERATVAPSKNRVEYQRGGVVEWYLNDAEGLEQGFALSAPPEGGAPPDKAGAAKRPAHLDLALTGDLRPVLSEDGQAIDFAVPGGGYVIHYAQLKVRDARGAALPAWFEGYAGPGGGGIRIVIDDSDAVYPITVDPLATSPAWMVVGDQTSAWFGYSVGTAGDVNGDGFSDVIVGAYLYDNGQMDEGRVYVYLGAASGLSLTPAWTAESDQASAQFGTSVGTAGDVNGDGYSDVIVGAPYYDNGQADEGRVYVYLGSASGLSATPAWSAESNQASSVFGYAVGTAGDVDGDGFSDVIVGAIAYDNGQTDEGRAYLYRGSASGLSPTPAWTAESNQASAWFGNSVGTAGDVNGDGYADVIVGAYYYDNGLTDTGRAYVYLGSTSGLAPTPAWTAASSQGGANFGTSVGTAGDVNGDGYADVIVGAPNYTNGQTNEGRAFVYLGSASGLSSTPAWTAESDQASALFGWSAATAGDVNGDGYADVVVGAYFYDNPETSEGRAYVYLGSASGLSSTPIWTTESNIAYAFFGLSVGTAGDVNGDGYADVIVGAPYSGAGRAYVYLGSGAGPASLAGWSVQGALLRDRMGGALSTAGDVNGDGYDDIIVGEVTYNYGYGRALVYLGSDTGPASAYSWSTTCFPTDGWCGGSVASAGDVNGDGYADVIVGASETVGAEQRMGRAYLYLGSASGLATTPAWVAEGEEPGAGFGSRVASAGDVNGDGYSDVIVGAPGYDSDPQKMERVYAYYGSASGLPATPSWVALADQANIGFGAALSTAGDVNGDGYSDIIVGATGYSNGQEAEGRAYVYLGSAWGLGATPAWTAESDQKAAFSGSSVATAGDVNGDGYSDVIVGAYGDDYDPLYHGRVRVYHGSPTGLATTPSWMVESDQADSFFGFAVAPAGDVNGDGFADVVVGAIFYTNGETWEGRAYVYLGSAYGLAATPSWWAEGNQPSAFYGSPVAAAGDVNGDGYSDVLVGGPSYDGADQDSGRADLYYGNGGPGLALRPRQRRSDDTAPVGPLGMSDDPSSFRLGLQGRTPFGRGLARLQWEAKTLGSRFDGTGLASGSAWSSTGTSGINLSEIAAGFAPGDRVHWRARLHYNPATVPFQQHGRWLTMPRNGPEETDLRTLLAADFAVTQADLADPVLVGETSAYSLDIQNLGPDTSTAELLDTLPAGAAFVSAAGAGLACTQAMGVVHCSVDPLPPGGHRTATVTVTYGAAGTAANLVQVGSHGRDMDWANDTATETTTVLVTGIGDRVWQDYDADGVQDPVEAGQPGTIVALYRGDASFVGSTITDANGAYSFPDLTYGEYYSLRFFPPDPLVFSPADNGLDDAADSDANPASGRTITFRLLHGPDVSRWDAGVKWDSDGDGHTVWYNDCDDNDPTVYPGAPPRCDGKNNDCNDPLWPAVLIEEGDRDGDGYRYCDGDCNDANPAIHPGAAETCDGYDDNCDGRIDEGCDGTCDLPAKIGSEVDLNPSATNAGAPRLAWTGNGYGMVYTDTRDGNNEIYLALLDGALNRIGSDVRVTNAAGTSTAPQAAWTGTDFGVVWQDDRDGNQEIYFARLGATGAKLTGDIRVTNATGSSRVPRIAWTGSDFGVLWNDLRDTTLENYFVRLDVSGQALGPERRITATPNDSGTARFAWTGSVYGVVYNDLRDGDYEIYFQTLDRYGNTVTPETRLTNSPGNSRAPVIAWDGATSQFGVAWVDNRSGYSDQLFFTRVALDGTKHTGDHALLAIGNPGTVVVGIANSGGEWGLAWADSYTDNMEIYFARVALDAFNGAPIRVTNNSAIDQNPSIEWTGTEYAIAFADNSAGVSAYHPYAARVGCCTVSTIGDRAWSDTDRNGLQDAGEGGASGVVVGLYDNTGGLLQATLTGADGLYGFLGLSCGTTYSLRFFPPAGSTFSPANQGADDTLDSDADPATGLLGPFMLSSALDLTRWDAGIVACWPPDEPIFIANVRLSTDGNKYPILDIQDPNQPGQVTGYDIYRSSVAGLPPGSWTLVGSDIVDMDNGTANIQWVDRSGDVSPTGAWFYQATAYNHLCPAEGPR